MPKRNIAPEWLKKLPRGEYTLDQLEAFSGNQRLWIPRTMREHGCIEQDGYFNWPGWKVESPEWLKKLEPGDYTLSQIMEVSGLSRTAVKRWLNVFECFPEKENKKWIYKWRGIDE